MTAIKNMDQFWAEVERLDPEGFAKGRVERSSAASATASVKDAERYRKIRRGQHWSVVNGIGDVLRGDELDAQVDAVIEVGSSDTAPKD